MGASAVSGALGGIGIIGGAASARSAASAARAQAAAMNNYATKQYNASMALAQPGLDAAKFAIPQLEGLTRMYGERVGQDDPTLKQGLSNSLAGIGRQQAQEVGLANLRFGSTGNVGAQYGAGLRAQRAANDSTNQAKLGYAQSQLAYKEGNLRNYAGSLGSMAQMGQQGTAQALSANNQYYGSLMNNSAQRGAYQQDMYGDLGDMFGNIAGKGIDAFTQSRKKNLYNPQTGAKL